MITREIDTREIESVKLPAFLKNSKVLVIEDNDTLIVKKIQTPSISQIREKLRAIKGKITEKEIEQEIQAYRKNK